MGIEIAAALIVAAAAGGAAAYTTDQSKSAASRQRKDQGDALAAADREARNLAAQGEKAERLATEQAQAEQDNRRRSQTPTMLFGSRGLGKLANKLGVGR